MSNITIDTLPTASTIDGVNDILPIYTKSITTTQGISRNTLLGITSQPVGRTDNQTLTNKTLTSPTINGATFSGTLAGTYTIGGTPTFPSSVVSLTGSQTLTNKILTSPTINAPTITNANITADTVSGFSSANTGTIYGVGVTTGQISTSSSVLPAALATGISYTKFKNDYKFSVWRNAAFSVGNGAYILLTYDTKEYDTGSNYNTSTGLFTAPIAGFYHFQVSVQYQGVVDGNTTITALSKNSTTVETKRITEAVPGNTGNVTHNGGTDMQLAANDTICVLVRGQGGNGGPGQSITWFNGFLVSAT